MRSAPLIASLLLAVIVAGCGSESSGGGDDGDNSALKYRAQERAAAQTIEDFATAIRGDDWKRICQDLFSESQRELTGGIVSGSCEKEIDSYSDLGRLRLTVTGVSLDNSARVDTTTASGGEATFDLEQEGGAWKIDGTSGDFTAGGEPSGDAPYGGGDQAAVGQVVLDYDRARADEDWATLCGLLSESRRGFAYSDCEADVRDEHGGGALGLTIANVEVKREANVQVRTGKAVALTSRSCPRTGAGRSEATGVRSATADDSTRRGNRQCVVLRARPERDGRARPWLLTDWDAYDMPLVLRVVGGVTTALGAAFLVQAFVRFVVEGLGTPAPIAPPERLVVGGIYRWVRNPMYVAVIATILGQALLLGRPVLVLWAAVFWAVTASFVRFYEEPHLTQQFGAEYERYLGTVPGWIPRPPRA